MTVSTVFVIDYKRYSGSVHMICRYWTLYSFILDTWSLVLKFYMNYEYGEDEKKKKRMKNTLRRLLVVVFLYRQLTTFTNNALRVCELVRVYRAASM